MGGMQTSQSPTTETAACTRPEAAGELAVSKPDSSGHRVDIGVWSPGGDTAQN